MKFPFLIVSFTYIVGLLALIQDGAGAADTTSAKPLEKACRAALDDYKRQHGSRSLVKDPGERVASNDTDSLSHTR